jgi:capsular polysaccharide biosynthesis protein
VPPRKLRNVSHWLLDCVPQVVALRAVAPDADLLLPPVLTEINLASLSVIGVPAERVVPWNGEPTWCDRLLIFESDGRRGGGRPLSPLLDLRQMVAPPDAANDRRRGRRIYVSRRDARKKRRWVDNEPQMEALFASRGFDIVSMTDLPFAEAVRIFREASVVAGVNGAGLAHILFSPPGTDVVVILSDSLIRWHAAAAGARSLWASGAEAATGELAPLGDSPRFYAHVAALFEQVCHAFVGADDMPIDRLSTFLDDVLTRSERAS